jgi:hypothetical protein
MCMCDKPNINGQPGYSWDGKTGGVYPVRPPVLLDGEELIYDEPGRCGGQDSHCHHFRLVKRHGDYVVVVRHGGGEERFRIASHRPGATPLVESMERMDSNGRYWSLHLLYYSMAEAALTAQEQERMRWTAAAAEKRIKLRRRNGGIRVDIMPQQVESFPTA